MTDDAESVRLAAVRAATRVNVFSDVASVVALVGDESPLVRRAAADSLGAMRARGRGRRAHRSRLSGARKPIRPCARPRSGRSRKSATYRHAP